MEYRRKTVHRRIKERIIYRRNKEKYFQSRNGDIQITRVLFLLFISILVTTNTHLSKSAGTYERSYVRTYKTYYVWGNKTRASAEEKKSRMKKKKEEEILQRGVKLA